MIGVQWGELESAEGHKRVSQTRIGEFVAGSPPFGRCRHQPTTAQASQVVADVGSAAVEIIGEFGGVRGARKQGDENALPSTVGQSFAEPGEHINVYRRGSGCHPTNYSSATAESTQPFLAGKMNAVIGYGGL